MLYEHIYDDGLLLEVAVESSWIEDLEYEDGDVIMTLHSGRSYSIASVDEDLYDMWVDADSKGRFWHSYIRGMYVVTRLT